MKSVFSVQKAVFVWLGSVFLMLAVITLNELLPESFRWLLWTGFFGGHCALVLLLAKGPWSISILPSKNWWDFLIVLSAFWVGPICWSLERRRPQNKSDKANLRLVTLLLFLATVAVLIFRFGMKF